MRPHSTALVAGLHAGVLPRLSSVAVHVALALSTSFAAAQNSAVVTQIRVANQQSPESVTLRKDKRWTSASGGWLKAQSGTWIQASTQGVALKDGKGGDLALMKGLTFDTAKEGESGDFRYDAGGDSGRWLVYAIPP